jgi:acyl carrier protein
MPTSQQIRAFIFSQYESEFTRRELTFEQMDADFDLLNHGIVDSLGVLELVNALEEAFGIQIDLADLDAESLTIVGPLSEHVAAHAVPRTSVGVSN